MQLGAPVTYLLAPVIIGHCYFALLPVWHDVDQPLYPTLGCYVPCVMCDAYLPLTLGFAPPREIYLGCAARWDAYLPLTSGFNCWVVPRHLWPMAPCYHGTMVPWCHGTKSTSITPHTPYAQTPELAKSTWPNPSSNMMRTRNNLSQLYVQTLAVVKREDKSVQNVSRYCDPFPTNALVGKGSQ